MIEFCLGNRAAMAQWLAPLRRLNQSALLGYFKLRTLSSLQSVLRLTIVIGAGQDIYVCGNLVETIKIK